MKALRYPYGVVLALVVFLVAHPALAQKPSHDVLMLVRTERHLSAAIQTAGELHESRTLTPGKIEIIVCGEASRALVKGTNHEAAIRLASQSGVTLTACGMSLKQMKIDSGQLVDVVQVVPNGLLRALELQADGYLSVEL